MATSYDDIYAQALYRMKAYDLVELDKYMRSVVLDVYHKATRAKFARICKSDLSRHDDEARYYEEDLSEDEIDTLAIGICYEWLSAQTLNSDLIQNVVSTKEFSFFSPANLLRELSALRDTLKREFRQAMTDYSLSRADVSNLRGE